MGISARVRGSSAFLLVQKNCCKRKQLDTIHIYSYNGYE